MIKSEVVVNAPIKVVWSFITTPATWEGWFGAKIVDVVPTFQSGASVRWENGQSMLGQVVPERLIELPDRLYMESFEFTDLGNGTSRIEHALVPTAVATFRDGGLSKKRELDGRLRLLKSALESTTLKATETSAPVLDASTEGGAPTVAIGSAKSPEQLSANQFVPNRPGQLLTLKVMCNSTRIPGPTAGTWSYACSTHSFDTSISFHQRTVPCSGCRIGVDLAVYPGLDWKHALWCAFRYSKISATLIVAVLALAVWIGCQPWSVERLHSPAEDAGFTLLLCLPIPLLLVMRRWRKNSRLQVFCETPHHALLTASGEPLRMDQISVETCKRRIPFYPR